MSRRPLASVICISTCDRQRTKDKDDVAAKQEAKSLRMFLRKSYERRNGIAHILLFEILLSAAILLNQLNRTKQ